MKKQIAVLAALLCSVPAFAQADKLFEMELSAAALNQALSAAAEKAALPANKEALKLYTQADFRVKTILYENGNGPEAEKTEDKNCKLYALDNNWVIGSVKCIGTAKTEYGPLGEKKLEVAGRSFSGDLDFINYSETVTPEEGKNFFIRQYGSAEGKDTAVNRSKGFFLVYVGNKTAITNRLNQQQKPYLYIPAEGKNIFSLFADGIDKKLELKIQTFCAPVFDVVRTRQLKTQSYVNGYFRVNDEMYRLSGEAGDPIFVLDTQHERAYLAGFNAGDMFGTNGKMIARGDAEDSAYFYDFTDEDYLFIKNVIAQKDPKAWSRLSNRIVRDIKR